MPIGPVEQRAGEQSDFKCVLIIILPINIDLYGVLEGTQGGFSGARFFILCVMAKECQRTFILF